MKNIFVILCLILLTGCVTRYEATGVEGLRNILVVDGIITDSVTTIKLSRSVGLTDTITEHVFVDNATLYVECDDGILSDVSSSNGKGTYTIKTGDLNPRQKYRLNISLEGEEYQSEFLSPLITPEFELSWVKDADFWSKISILVSTQDTLDQSRYYLWSYKEDWEYTARIPVDSFCINGEWVPHDIHAPGNRYYCWKKDSSRTFIMETAEQLTGSMLINKEILSINSASERLSYLYHIEVKQNLIRKEAFTYYANIQKNAEGKNNIFAPISAEVPGNLHCTTSPHLPVIGFVEVSTDAKRKLFITGFEAYNYTRAYRSYEDECVYILFQEPPDPSVYLPPECNNSLLWQWVSFEWKRYHPPWRKWPKKWFYTHRCVDCLSLGGTKNKPGFWPNDHQ